MIKETNTVVKEILNTNLENEALESRFEELSNIDDLWYFIKSSSGAWIVGSAN